jgi:protein-tyrosine-phosphatase
MAAALLRDHLAQRAERVVVASAGFVAEGVPPPPQVLDAMSALGLDLSDHRSRLVTPGLVQGADLVVGMARQHVIDLALLSPGTWDRCFTFADLLRRGRSCGPRLRSETVRQWTQRISGARTRASLVALPLSEDVPDPMGGRHQDYELARDDLAARTARLGFLLSASA